MSKEINQSILEAAGKLKDHTNTDAEAMTIAASKEVEVEVDGKTKKVSLFEATTGIPTEEYKRVTDGLHTFAAAAEHVTGEYGITMLDGKEKDARVTGTYPLPGRDSYTTVMKHTKETRHPGTGEPIINHGVVTGALEIQATKATADIKAVRSALKDLAAEALGG